MNAAARFLSQSTVSKTWVVSVLLSKVNYGLFTLIFSVIVSSLSIVYVTNVSRGLNAGIAQAFSERDRLHIQWGQLLLEKSTLMMQSRIQHVASDQLEMIVPESKSVVIINE